MVLWEDTKNCGCRYGCHLVYLSQKAHGSASAIVMWPHLPNSPTLEIQDHAKWPCGVVKKHGSLSLALLVEDVESHSQRAQVSPVLSSINRANYCKVRPESDFPTPAKRKRSSTLQKPSNAQIPAPLACSKVLETMYKYVLYMGEAPASNDVFCAHLIHRTKGLLQFWAMSRRLTHQHAFSHMCPVAGMQLLVSPHT